MELEYVVSFGTMVLMMTCKCVRLGFQAGTVVQLGWVAEPCPTLSVCDFSLDSRLKIRT